MIANLGWRSQDGISAKNLLRCGNLKGICVTLPVLPNGDRTENIRKFKFDDRSPISLPELCAGRKSGDCEASHREFIVPSDELIN